MNYYALQYTLSADYINKRTAFRTSHFNYITPYFEKGVLLMGGAYDHSEEGALLIFRTDNSSIIEDFAKRDPYVINGVVTEWKILKWNVAIGNK